MEIKKQKQTPEEKEFLDNLIKNSKFNSAELELLKQAVFYGATAKQYSPELSIEQIQQEFINSLTKGQL